MPQQSNSNAARKTDYCAPGLQSLEQLFNRNLERRRKPLDTVQRQVRGSALNATHIAAGKTAPIGKVLLRHSGIASKLAHPVAE